MSLEIFVFFIFPNGVLFLVYWQSDMVFNSTSEVVSHVGLRGVFEDNDARWKLSQIDDTFPATRFAKN